MDSTQNISFLSILFL